MDFFATSLSLAGVDHALPAGYHSDSIDFSPVLTGRAGTREVFYYWGKSPSPPIGLHAVRKGDWKVRAPNSFFF
jgi:hypothetical protein